MNKKQVIRICYTDFSPIFNYKHDFIYQILNEKYEIIIDEKNPDYVIYSCFNESRKHLYFDSIRIYLSAENTTPDFNFADYALSHDYLEFGDRYFRVPYWRWILPSVPDHHPRSFYEQQASSKKKFCNFIYSNSWCAAPQRESFFNLLSQAYKQVDSGGAFRNNIGDPIEDKVAWQRDYKFSIAFENSSQPGYTTEKIIDALKADTIPIYWGDPCIAQEINPKRFINVHDFDSFDAVIKEVKRLDQDEKAYIDMLSQPWFMNNIPPLLQDETLRAWLFHIFDQDKEQARRITYFGNRQLYLNAHRLADKHHRKAENKKLHKKKLRPLIKTLEYPFRKLRDKFCQLRRKSS